MADLLNPEKENEIYQPSIKVVFLLIFEVGSAFLMSFYFRQLIVEPSAGSLIFFLTGLGLFFTFSFFSSLLVKGFIWSSLGVGLAVVASLTVFYDYFSPTLIFSGLIIFLIFLWAVSELRSAVADSLKIRFFNLAKIFLSKITFGLALMLTIFCYFLLPVDGFPLSFKNFQFLVKPNEKIIAVFIPNFSFDKNLEEILLEKMPAEIKGTAFEKIEFLGFKISVAEAADKAIFEILQTKFKQLNAKTQKLIIIGTFVGLFFIFQFLFFLLKLIFPIILFLIYLLLAAFNFINTKVESRSKEVVSL